MKKEINKKRKVILTEEKEIGVKETTSLSFKNVMKNYCKFYNEKLKKKHIIVYIISLVAFFIIMAYLISKVNSTPDIASLVEKTKELKENSKSLASLILYEKIPLTFMIILSGIAPYFFIPVIGVGVSYNLAFNIVSNFNVLTGKSSIVFMCIGAIIEQIGICLAIATGIEYCIITTKKWRYTRNQDYSMLDFKKTFYEATKNNKKLKETKSKQELKKKKNEKNNVKVPYMYLLVSFIVSSLIIIIGTIIAKV